MPCSDNGWTDALRQKRELEDNKFGNKEISTQIAILAKNVDDLIVRNNKLAKMLCSIMRLSDSDSRNFLYGKVEGLKKWWEDHQKFDASEGRF